MVEHYVPDLLVSFGQFLFEFTPHFNDLSDQLRIFGSIAIVHLRFKVVGGLSCPDNPAFRAVDDVELEDLYVLLNPSGTENEIV